MADYSKQSKLNMTAQYTKCVLMSMNPFNISYLNVQYTMIRDDFFKSNCWSYSCSKVLSGFHRVVAITKSKTF
jgi:hypothetical protein